MSSQFLKKMEEEQKKGTLGELKNYLGSNNEMKEEDEEMEDEEEKDSIQDLDQSNKIPLPNNMYTKPVDVNQVHHFHKPANPSGICYDPIGWEHFFDKKAMMDDRVPVYVAGQHGHVFVCLHGAGHSALSFATFAKYMKHAGVVAAFDFRGHGGNKTANETEMSEENLIADTLEVLRFLQTLYPEKSFILVGHSMGGSIATKATQKIMTELKDDSLASQVQGLFVIDVVEGSAMDALPFMENIVLSRPTEFKSLQAVVQFGVKTGAVRDIQSARASMPDQVIPVTDQATGITKYVWRTDLMGTKPYWESWFKGLSSSFLGLRLPKQLLLAASDRMDKELTIAHMSGKLKMVVIDDCGHCMHEDQPMKVADQFLDFLAKFKIPAKFNEQMFVTSVSGKKIVINH